MNLAKRGNQAAYRKGYRKPGTVQKAVSVRTSKASRQAGNVGVFVNVRPAKKGQRGAKNWRDPFYWSFLYRGTKHQPARPFLDAGGKVIVTSVVIDDGVKRPADQAAFAGVGDDFRVYGFFDLSATQQDQGATTIFNVFGLIPESAIINDHSVVTHLSGALDTYVVDHCP
jgi:hypothetical protein